MYTLPPHVRARVSTLGELSRPLGEARAAAFAREIAANLVAEVAAGRDPERALDAWITRIACEIAAKTQRKAAPGDGSHVRPVKDLLPEVQ
jgi:hypothetical protein